jgi:hypothetical protein
MREEQKRNEFPAENALVMKPAFAMAGNTTCQEKLRDNFIKNSSTHLLFLKSASRSQTATLQRNLFLPTGPGYLKVQ